MTMKLMTKKIAAAIPGIGGQEKVTDPIAYVKYFDPCGSWTWFCTEYDPSTGRMFGLVKGHETELGYFSLPELASVHNRMGLGIERDRSFRPTPLSKIKSGEVR